MHGIEGSQQLDTLRIGFAVCYAIIVKKSPDEICYQVFKLLKYLKLKLIVGSGTGECPEKVGTPHADAGTIRSSQELCRCLFMDSITICTYVSRQTNTEMLHRLHSV